MLHTIFKSFSIKEKNAVDYLSALHERQPTPSLQNYFDSFKNPPVNPSEKTLIAGIQQFIQIVNSNAPERNRWYSDELQGLHFDNELASLWNIRHPANPITTVQLAQIAPPSWQIIPIDQTFILMPRGNKPLSLAFNELVQGPTRMDCGMSWQFGFWMSIRRYLGDKAFDTLFQHMPFYITQGMFTDPVEVPEHLNYSNPLYHFFKLTASADPKQSTLKVIYVHNDKRYKLKHLGGVSPGENCIVINDTYTIFSPQRPTTEFATKTEVESFLRAVYNAPQDEHDQAHLKEHAKQPSHKKDHHGQTFGWCIEQAKYYANHQITENNWEVDANDEEAKYTNLTFDYATFSQWVADIKQARSIQTVHYQYNEDKLNNLPSLLLDVLPNRNKQASFFNFDPTFPVRQTKLKQSGFQFCQSILENKPHLTILSGEKNIGKTHTAVACYKELASHGKRVLWLSEISMENLEETLQFSQLEESAFTQFHNRKDKTSLPDTSDFNQFCAQLRAQKKELQEQLTSKLDAVFLDQNELFTYRGKILLQSAYQWYTQHLNKGLFITSTQHNFSSLYGFDPLNNTTACLPPLLSYTHPAYQNMTLQLNLTASGLNNTLDNVYAEGNRPQYLNPHK